MKKPDSGNVVVKSDVKIIPVLTQHSTKNESIKIEEYLPEVIGKALNGRVGRNFKYIGMQIPLGVIIKDFASPSQNNVNEKV